MQYFIFKKQLRDVSFLASSSFFLFLHVLWCQSKQSLNYIIFLIIFKRPYIDILIIVSFFPLKLLDSFLSLFLSVKKSHLQAVIFSNYQIFSLPSSKRWLPHFTHAHTNSWFFFSWHSKKQATFGRPLVTASNKRPSGAHLSLCNNSERWKSGPCAVSESLK
jgi:hypothetical protein